MTRQAIFSAVNQARGKSSFTQKEVDDLDAVLDRLGVPRADGPKKTSKAGIDLIKASEGLELRAYPDPGSGSDPWTIGYGTTKGVRKGMIITEYQAEQFLVRDLAEFEEDVNRLCPVTTQSQFDALVSFCYNVGPRNLEGSTLRKLHNLGRYEEAANEFQKWNKGSGKVLPGLVKRRAAEAKLYRAKP